VPQKLLRVNKPSLWTIALLEIAMYIATPICGCILCQGALGDCMIKFESNSFRILLSAGYNSFELFDLAQLPSWGSVFSLLAL